MTPRTEIALVLPAARTVGSEPVHFGGFPGLWYPERPIALSALGFETPDEALEAARELPLVTMRVEVGSAPMPERENHVDRGGGSNAIEAEKDGA